MGEDIDKTPAGVPDFLACVQSKQRPARGYVISDEIKFSAGITPPLGSSKIETGYLNNL
jgi:hypothetical protein